MKIAAWNIEGRLSPFAMEGERGSPKHILKGIESLDSDLIFLPEAFDAARPVEREVADSLRRLGYTACFDTPYGSTDSREDAATLEPHMMILSRVPFKKQELLPQVGGMRNMLSVDVIDPESSETIRLFGLHLDDRTEEGRLKQVSELVPRIAESEYSVVALGDFNATHSDSMPAFLFGNRLMRWAIWHFPEPRMRDVLQRASDMTVGETLRYFEEHTGLVDASRKLTVTPKARGQEWFPSIPMMEIDHMYTTSDLKVSDVKVARDYGADHRAIRANISFYR